MSLAHTRKDYEKHELLEADAGLDPIDLFNRWLKDAIEASQSEVTAMTLSTVTRSGRPTARVVLLKGIHENQFQFFTNYLSDKGEEIAANPLVCLSFFWPEFERQVRIEGVATKVPAEVSDEYFKIRPRPSQLGAWASKQSSRLESREQLDQRFAEVEAKFADNDVPRPTHWGGYNVAPNKIEFWQGRPSRLHDRLCYELDANQKWSRVRLSPLRRKPDRIVHP